MIDIKNTQLDDKKFKDLGSVISENSSFALSSLPQDFIVKANVECDVFVSLEALDSEISLNVILEESAILNFVVLVSGRNIISNFNYKVSHIGSRSRSNFVFKSLLDGESDLSFSGIVHVPKESSSVVSDLKHDTLLLSRKSKVSTKPALEIYNDDVEVEHSASVGHFDEQQLFYLQSRGLSYNLSKVLLMDAFLISDLKIFSEKFYKRITNEL